MSSKFAGTARFYRNYRPEYPPHLWDLLLFYLGKESRGVGPETLLLDLGAGTGEIPRAIGEHFDRAVLVEPDTEMYEAQTDVSLNVKSDRFLSSAEHFDYQNALGFSVATIGRAFHWMPQEQVVRSLQSVAASSSLLAIVGDGSLWSSREAWAEDVRAIVKRYLGEERRAGSGRFMAPSEPYEDLLQRLGCSGIVKVTVPVRREWSPEDVVGYLSSTSFAAPALFGDDFPRFRSELLGHLNELAASSPLIERAQATMVLCRLS